MAALERTWKVGELARATGLTIRTLHHYDEIGLLVPADRTDAGHRLYSRADVERLYRILALRRLGLALDEIGALLDDDGGGLIDTVRRHVALVERDIEHRRRLLERLRDMLGALERSAAPSVDALIGTVEAMTVVDATIADVYVRVSPLLESQPPYVVVLEEVGGARLVPIFIGEPEARALVVARRGDPLPRPLGPDLTLRLLDAAGARVERVVVEALRDNIFRATVTIATGGEPHEIDARPSDALNLAARSQARIHVATEVVEVAGVTAWPGEDEQHEGLAGEYAGRSPEWVRVGSGAPGPPAIRVGPDSQPTLLLATAEAQRLGDGLVGCEHLLLGILAGDDDVAAPLLAERGVTVDVAREVAAESSRDACPNAVAGDVSPLGPRAQIAIRRARTDAWRSGVEAPTPGHLLIAVIRSGDPAAAEILRRSDVDGRALLAEAEAALRS